MWMEELYGVLQDFRFFELRVASCELHVDAKRWVGLVVMGREGVGGWKVICYAGASGGGLGVCSLDDDSYTSQFQLQKACRSNFLCMNIALLALHTS